MKGHFPGVSEVTDTVGGWLCLDFADTVDNYNKPTMDLIPDFDALVKWEHKKGIIDGDEVERLAKLMEKRYIEFEEITGDAHELRGAIYGVFAAIAHGHKPAPGHLWTLNKNVREALGHVEVGVANDGFAWTWNWGSEPRCVLWPLARSAASLLTSPELKRLRQCDGYNCTWLFLDRSKNRSRRWCEMEVCGNRAKARKHYARMAGGGEAGAS